MLPRNKNMHNIVYLKVVGFVIFENETLSNKNKIKIYII